MKTPNEHKRLMSRRAALAGVAAAALPGALRAQSLATVRVGGVPAETTLPLVYAMRAGLFKRAGINIDLQGGRNGAETMAAITSNDLDIGGSGMLSIVLAHAHGIPIKIVAPSGYYDAETPGGLLVLNSSPLRVAKDFNGKTIGTGTLSDINVLGLYSWMDKNGGDRSTLKFLEMPVPALPAALNEGRVDGIIPFDPIFTVAMATGNVRLVTRPWNSIAPRILWVGWCASATWIDSNRDVAQRFAHVMADASTYCNTHAAETVDDLVGYTKLDRDLVLHMKRIPQTPVVQASDIQPLIDVAVKYNMLTASFPASELIASTALT